MKQLRGANSTGVFANCLDVLAINNYLYSRLCQDSIDTDFHLQGSIAEYSLLVCYWRHDRKSIQFSCIF